MVCSVAVVVTGEAVVLTAGTVTGEAVEADWVGGTTVAAVVSRAVATGSVWLALL